VGCGGALALILIIGWVVPTLDRAQRTTFLAGLTSAVNVHTAPDGRLVVTEGGDGSGPNGSVVIIDVATDVRTVALSGLSWASAADMNPDGLVCATTNGMNAKSPELRCSDGRQVALISDASNTVGAGDVLWDGTSGWYVADYANSDLLHVDDSGSLTRTASFDFPYFSETPIALARGSNGRILAALVGRGVVVAVPTSATPPLIDGKSDDVIVGVVSVPDGVLTLTRAKVGDVGALACAATAAARSRMSFSTALPGRTVSRC
jgi:hypothetical protein